MKLTYKNNSLPSTTVDMLVNEAQKLNVPPSYLITKLHYEGLWGGSQVAQQNNNLSGMTWTGDPKRPSGVTVSRGSARPANEGGYYMRYATLDDFFTDWLYLIRRGGNYNVADSETFSEAVKGMFKVGGAKYDYATMNVSSSQRRYELYLQGMQARRKAINDANGGALDQLDKKGQGESMTTANDVLSQAKAMLGVTQKSSKHKALVNEYNSVSQNVQRNGGGHYNATTSDDWCDIFVSMMFKRAGGSDLIGVECGVQHHKNYMQQLGIWRGVIKPQAGDVIIYDWQGKGRGWADHIGIVESFDGVNVHTIEGNVGSAPRKVARKTYRYNANFVEGYARPRFGAGSSVAQASGKDPKVVSAEVLAGVWGNGDARVNNLTAKGYDARVIQDGVNELVSWSDKDVDFLADKVIDNYFGVGDTRTQALKAIGADPGAVQKRVNEKVKANELPDKTVEEVVQEVLAGEWGNNPDRAKKLTDAGYDAVKVQGKVNELLDSEGKEGGEVLVEAETQTGNEGADLKENEVILDGVRYVINKVE